jgi:hypothetical protein
MHYPRPHLYRDNNVIHSMDPKVSQSDNKMWNKSWEYKANTSAILTITAISHKINLALNSSTVLYPLGDHLLQLSCSYVLVAELCCLFFYKNIKINLSYWSKTSEDGGHHLIPYMVFVCVDSLLRSMCSIIILTACSGVDWGQD